MTTANVENIIRDLCDPASGLLESVSPHLRLRLAQSLAASLQKSSLAANGNANESMVDLVPVDSPVGTKFDAETGVLHIQFHFHTGRGQSLALRELRVSPEAQRELLPAIFDAYQKNEASGRSQPKPATLQ